LEASKERREAIEERTQALQEQFAQLFGEIVSKREKDTTGNFYEVMEEYYWKGKGDERHVSPTKRLISLKNSTTELKKALKGGVKLSQTYSLTYCSAPGRSYVIEPHGGELNYGLAERNLPKFFE